MPTKKSARKAKVLICSKFLTCNIGDQSCTFKDNFSWQRPHNRRRIRGGEMIINHWPPHILCGPSGWLLEGEEQQKMAGVRYDKIKLIRTTIDLDSVPYKPF